MKRAILFLALSLSLAGCSATYRPFPFGWYGDDGVIVRHVFRGQDTMNIRKRGYSRYVEYRIYARDTYTGKWRRTIDTWTLDIAVYDWEKIEKPVGIPDETAPE
jgi:hypothetical protein